MRLAHYAALWRRNRPCHRYRFALRARLRIPSHDRCRGPDRSRRRIDCVALTVHLAHQARDNTQAPFHDREHALAGRCRRLRRVTVRFQSKFRVRPYGDQRIVTHVQEQPLDTCVWRLHVDTPSVGRLTRQKHNRRALVLLSQPPNEKMRDGCIVISLWLDADHAFRRAALHKAPHLMPPPLTLLRRKNVAET